MAPLKPRGFMRFQMLIAPRNTESQFFQSAPILKTWFSSKTECINPQRNPTINSVAIRSEIWLNLLLSAKTRKKANPLHKHLGNIWESRLQQKVCHFRRCASAAPANITSWSMSRSLLATCRKTARNLSGDGF